MRKGFTILVIALMLAATAPAFADLQNVTVGGSIRIRGNWWSSEFSPDSLYGRNPLFQGPFAPSTRPIVNPFRLQRWAAQPGRLGIAGLIDWDDAGASTAFELPTAALANGGSGAPAAASGTRTAARSTTRAFVRSLRSTAGR